MFDSRGSRVRLGQACDAAGSSLARTGLARQGGFLEAEPLPARMLGEIARGARVGNADLAELLGTDAWQLSRAGRRLRDAGLLPGSDSGRIDVWDLTADGRKEIIVYPAHERHVGSSGA